MKKLLLALALLAMFSSRAFATCNEDTDKFDTKGWCIDTYGTLTPKAIAAYMNGSGTAATQGGKQDPVIYTSTAYSTYDTLAAYQSGSVIIDNGGSTTNVAGAGHEYILPAAAKGLFFKFVVASASTITIDTLTTSDSILWTTLQTAGYGLKNSSKTTADSIMLISPAAGYWAVKEFNGTWVTSGGARVH